MNEMLKFAAITCAVAAVPASAIADAATKDFVVNAVTELFIEGDVEAIDRYWAEDYIQHNPMFPSGRGVIKDLFGNMPPSFKYEMGMVIADDDLVAIHARYTGLGPKPLVAVDIFRVEDGRIAEHWDILQEEVQETASGVPMFEPMQ
ncbi:MAG: nuclear transport factor 2 family protein [Sediminimonas sp.]|uniref:nuclear transport factor 2 family protein n=1 Tax=Sediminimonas sp. TaxID=2823379 RepID=UPI00286FC875|nr:nuclear transport factor 2 family protein [Sediminimonas sp.]MDR9483906.1 nuclear transport factor 2 family protein [Sediminimonas sp.]